MEPEERSKKLAEFVERREGDVFEVMAYAGTLKVNEREFTRPSKIPRYQRALIIPLPPDFDWTGIDVFSTTPHFPDSIVIEECRMRYKRKGKKKVNPMFAFLDKPRRTSVKKVNWTGKIGNWSTAWISKEKFEEITLRNLYIDKYYADKIFDRGKDRADT